MRPLANGRVSGTAALVSSVSGKPSASSSTGLSPCHVIVGSTTSTRPRRRPWTVSGATVAPLAEVIPTRYTPVGARRGSGMLSAGARPRPCRRGFRDPSGVSVQRSGPLMPLTPTCAVAPERTGSSGGAALGPAIVTPVPWTAVFAVGGRRGGDEPATCATFSTVTPNAYVPGGA